MITKFRCVVVGLAFASSACGDDGGRATATDGSATTSPTTNLTVGPTDTGTTDEPTGAGPLTSGLSDGATGTDTAPPTTTDATSTGTTGEPVTATDTDTSTSEPGTTTLVEPGTTTGLDPEDPLWVSPNLWYSVEDRLHYIEISPTDGGVVKLVTSTIATPLLDGFNGLTMLEDGSLLGSRVLEGMGTQIFHIPEPPVEPATIDVDIIGMVPDKLLIEALYTDCKGLVYLMDSGSDLSTAAGNRLIRFTGSYLSGDLDYEVITDLQNASVADIDDLGPGIDLMGEITDGTGFAIDSGEVYKFDYNNGTGSKLGNGGTWGSHALGGPLFTDATARLYLLDEAARLVEADPTTFALSPVLVTGPKPAGGAPAGWSGLTGPLTECESTLPQ